MSKRIQLTEEQKRRLLDNTLLPASVSVNNKAYTPEGPIAAGYKGAIWRVRDEFARLRALKLCIYADYQDRSYLQELSRASTLERFDEFARFIDAGLATVALGDNAAETFVCFVEEWIDGLTVAEFVKQHADLVTSAFLRAYVTAVCHALAALRSVGLRHDDLHVGNVMLRRPADTGSSEWTIKVIDTGSIKPADAPSNKPKDDHLNFVDHIVLISNTIHAKKILPARERRFVNEAELLIRSMLDDDPSIALRDPVQITTQFDLAFTRVSAPADGNGPSAHSPFEFISAEHISDDRLLVSMFALSCPLLEKVHGPDPCLVTGPRGCGKSTLFRWLSLKSHLHKPLADIDKLRITGFYVSCSSDLQNKLAWVRTDALADRFRRELIHYFNLLLAREVVQTLLAIAARPDRQEGWGFGTAQEAEVCRFILDSLGPTQRPRIQGVSRLAQAMDAIEVEMFSTHSQMVRGTNLSGCTTESFLGDLTTLLTREMPHFQRKTIVFLVDDYSSHRLPEAVQVVLNQVIWERRPTHVFKLSSEKYGAVLTDTLHATIDVTREMIEIDCGREYIALDDADQVQRAYTFAVELLDRRLETAGYSGTAEGLIGHSEWPEGSLGRALAEKRPGRVLDQYHGLECISSICSGDVSTLLFVYRKIFEMGGVKQTSTDVIPKAKQHTAVVSASRELFEAIKRHFPSGPEMYAIVAAFGNLVRNVLQHGRWQIKGPTKVPTQCPRIELDQRQGATGETLTVPQQELARELIRRAIFIEMEPGLSRHGNVTTLRWHLRRVFLPAFGASLAKNDAVKHQIDFLKFFLTDPQAACDTEWAKWPKHNPNGNGSGLFDGQTEGA